MDAILTNTKAWVSGLAGLVLAGTAIHEWLYHEHHKYASGPSEVLAIGFAAGAVVAFVVMFVARDLEQHERHIVQLLQPSGTRQDAETWLLAHAEEYLREHSPADFETTPNAAPKCVMFVSDVEGGEWWRVGYDSLDSFYAAHEARHPDIRVYAAVRREPPIVKAFADYAPEYVRSSGQSDWPEGVGKMIVQRIAAHRVQ